MHETSRIFIHNERVARRKNPRATVASDTMQKAMNCMSDRRDLYRHAQRCHQNWIAEMGGREAEMKNGRVTQGIISKMVPSNSHAAKQTISSFERNGNPFPNISSPTEMDSRGKKMEMESALFVAAHSHRAFTALLVASTTPKTRPSHGDLHHPLSVPHSPCPRPRPSAFFRCLSSFPNVSLSLPASSGLFAQLFSARSWILDPQWSF